MVERTAISYPSKKRVDRNSTLKEPQTILSIHCHTKFDHHTSHTPPPWVHSRYELLATRHGQPTRDQQPVRVQFQNPDNGVPLELMKLDEKLDETD